MFLTFEGIDSSGKTTQAQLAVEALRARPGCIVHFIREPGGTAISELLRGILLDKKNLELTKTTELLLFSASRAQLVQEVIIPALQRGEIVVCDRFYDSTTAYQGYGRGLDLDAVHRINAVATAATHPDLTILIDVTVEESMRRKKVAGAGIDRMESGGRAFYAKVREGYLAIARQNPDRFMVVDGMRKVEEIARVIADIIQGWHNRQTKEAR